MRVKKMFGEYESQDRLVDGAHERLCVFCGKWLPISSFPKNGYKEGVQQYRLDCRVCYNIRRQENSSKGKKRHSDFVGGQKRRGDECPTFSQQEWKECLIFFGGECAYCGCTTKGSQRMTRDHLVALSAGGATVAENIVPACHNCNSSKNDDDFREWYMKQSFFSQERLNRIYKWRTIMRQIGGE